MEDGILNDDCFLHIFKYLDLIDLANFKETYPSLAALADVEFCRKTRGSLDFRCRKEDGLQIKAQPRLDLTCSERSKDDALQIIKQFGSSIRDLGFDYCSLGKTKWIDIFSVIGKHCEEKLKSLYLVGKAVGHIKKADISLIVDILKNIETIELDTQINDKSYEFLTILAHCVNATSISLYSATIAIDLPVTIFQTNENLLSLRVSEWVIENDLKLLVDNLMTTRLEELFVLRNSNDSSVEAHLSELVRLNYLKRLSIQSHFLNGNSFLRNMDAFNSLDVLRLRYSRLDETSIAILGRITRLKVLQLHCCYLQVESQLESLLVLCANKNFEHLQLLCFDDIIDKLTFLKLIEKRKSSAAENCLHITFRHLVYTESVLAITPKLLEANKETVKLVERNDSNYTYFKLDFD